MSADRRGEGHEQADLPSDEFAMRDQVIEVLHIDECPNWQQTVDDVRAALAELGAPEVRVVERLIASPAQAAEVPFAGSPTILVDGADPFSTGETTVELACRVYRTDEGLRGTPSRRQLIEALADAAGAPRR